MSNPLKRAKRVLTFVLSVAMILTGVPQYAFAAEADPEAGVVAEQAAKAPAKTEDTTDLYVTEPETAEFEAVAEEETGSAPEEEGEEKNRVITVEVEEGEPAKIYYMFYEKDGDSFKVKQGWSSPLEISGNRATISVNAGEYIGFDANFQDDPEGKTNRNIITKSSVKLDGEVVSRSNVGGYYSYFIGDNDPHTLSVKSYAPVRIVFHEAYGHNFDNEADKAYTKSNAVGVGVVAQDATSENGIVVASIGDIEITSEETIINDFDEFYASMLMSTVKYGDEKEEELTDGRIVSAHDNIDTHCAQCIGTVSADFVERAVEAGKDIEIFAHAQIHPMAKVTVSTPSENGISFFYYHSGNHGGTWALNSSYNFKRELEIPKGASLDISNASGAFKANAAFAKYESEGRELPGDTACHIDKVTGDMQILISQVSLSANAVSVNLPSDGSVVYEPFEPVTYNGKQYVASNSPLVLKLEPKDDPVEIRAIAKPITYELLPGGISGEVEVRRNSSGDEWFSIPLSVLKKAAFERKTISINVSGTEEEPIGYRPQTVMITGTNADAKLKVGGVLKSSGTNISSEVKYKSDAVIDLSAKIGYKLDGVYYLPLDKAQAKLEALGNDDAAFREWLKSDAASSTSDVVSVNIAEGKDKELSFKIESVKKAYGVYYFAVPELTLTVDDVRTANKALIELPYNRSERTIKVYKGSAPLSLNAVTVSANILDSNGNAGEDVTDAVLSHGGYSVTFDGRNKPGTTIRVSLKSTDPAFDYYLDFKLSSKITDKDICFKSDKPADHTLGTSQSVDLKVAKNFDLSRVSVNAICASGPLDSLTSSVTVTGTKLIFSTSALKKADADKLLNDKSFTMQIIDGIDASLISSLSVNVIDKTTAVSLDGITAAGDATHINLDFSKVTGIPAGVENLYYYVYASRVNDVEGFISANEVLVPVNNKKLAIDVSSDNKPVKASCSYNVTIRLVQGSFSDADWDTVATETYGIDHHETVKFAETVPEEGQTFASRIKFAKSPLAPKAIYHTMTMDNVLLGEIEFPDVDKGKPVTVKLVDRYELYSSKGALLDSWDAGDLGNSVVLPGTPYYRDPGKYTLVAYAYEPDGADVCCKIPITIKRGIYDIMINAPKSIYKAPNKAASIKPAIILNNNYKTEKPASRSVVWSMDKSYDGVTVNTKSGLIKIDKNAEIPESGMNFTLKAQANDFTGSPVYATVDIEVSSVAEKPGMIRADGLLLKEGGVYYGRDLCSTDYGELQAYDSNGDPVEATFTLKGVGAYRDDYTKAVIGVWPTKSTKAKKASITATAKDGSKEKFTVHFTVKSDEDLKFDLEDSIGSNMDLTGSAASYSAHNTYGSGKPIFLEVYGANSSFIDHTLSFKGAKKVKIAKLPEKTYYALIPTAHVTKITIKQGNTTSAVINVTNDKITAGKTGTSVAASNFIDAGYDAKKGKEKQKQMKGKIFSSLAYESLDAYRKAGSFNKVTYTVKNGKKAATGKVLISTTDPELITLFLHAEGLEKIEPGEYLVALDADGRFAIDYVFYDDVIGEVGHFRIESGKHLFTVTPVDATTLEATAKAATVKLIAKPAPKAKVTHAGTIKDFGDKAAVNYTKTANIVFKGSEPQIVLTGLRGYVAKTGKISKFGSTLFEIRDGKLIVCKADPEGDLCYKNGSVTGCIVYSWTNLDGTTGTAQGKIVLKPAKNGKITPEL